MAVIVADESVSNELLATHPPTAAYAHSAARASKHRRGLGRWLALLAVILAGCGSAGLPRSSRGPEGSWRTFANGLRLFVAPESSGDLVRVHMRVRAGSRNETRAQAGLAHFSEHLAFARTLADGRTMLDALEEESLGFDASTHADSVDFVATTVAAHLPTVLRLFASALDGSCAVSPEVVTRERNVVLSEIATRMRGSAFAYDELLASIYSPDHPYGHVLSGTPATVSALTGADGCAYLRDRFTPGNTAVVITGGVTEARALAAAEATLKPLASRPASPEVVVPPVFGAGGRKTLAGLPGGWGIALVLRLPPVGSADGRLAAILADAVEAEVRALIAQAGWTSSFAVHRLGGAAAPAVMLVGADTSADGRMFFERLLEGAIDNVRKEVADREQVAALRRRLRLATAARHERLDTRAERLIEVVDGARLGTLATDLQAIDALTPAALTRVAEQVLAPGRVAVFELEPAPTRADTGLAEVAPVTGAAHAVTARPDVAARLLREIPATNRNSSYTLANGLTVVLAPSSSPLVDVRLVFAAGAVDAPREHPLLAAVAAGMLRPPKKGAPARAVAKMTAGGAELDVFFSHDVTIYKARGLAGETAHLLRGLSALVVSGSYDSADRAAAVVRVREEVIRQQAAESLRRRIARARLDRCDEPLVDTGGSDEFSDAAIAAFREEYFRAGRATLIVAGGFDEAVARAHVKAAFGGRQAPWGAGEPAPARASRPVPAALPDVFQIEVEDQGQVGVLLGLVVPSELRRDQGTLSLVRALLDDAVEGVRERLGISYGFWVSREELCDAELLLIGGDVDAAHLDQGLAELRQALARLRTREGVAAGLAAAQRPVAARLLAEASDTRVIAERLVYLARRGLPLDYFRGEAREVVEARADAVAEVMARLLARGRLFAVCLGPEGRLESCDSLSSL